MTKTGQGSTNKGRGVIPALRYHNAPHAIEWLGRAFGWASHLVVPDGQGGIAHAQLLLGDAMVMLGSVRDDAFSKLIKTPSEVGGIGTFCGYIVVADVDAHHDQAVAAGARVVYPLTDEEYGGRGYSCLDCEGHLWSFGTYDPWAPTP